MNVVVLGASINESRYSNMAVKALKEAGHRVFPVHSTYKKVSGIPTYSSVLDIDEKVDILSVYLSRESSSNIEDDILKLNPKKIVFNPGSENYSLRDKAEKQGIEVIFACTLVMLSTGLFNGM